MFRITFFGQRGSSCLPCFCPARKEEFWPVSSSELWHGFWCSPFTMESFSNLTSSKPTITSADSMRQATSPGDIVLVVVDQSSLDSAKRQGINWPWPRQMYVPIVQFCDLSGSRAVVIDILFTEPSSYGIEDDQLLGSGFEAQSSCLLASFLSRDERPQDPWGRRFLIALPCLCKINLDDPFRLPFL